MSLLFNCFTHKHVCAVASKENPYWFSNPVKGSSIVLKMTGTPVVPKMTFCVSNLS